MIIRKLLVYKNSFGTLSLIDVFHKCLFRNVTHSIQFHENSFSLSLHVYILMFIGMRYHLSIWILFHFHLSTLPYVLCLSISHTRSPYFSNQHPTKEIAIGDNQREYIIIIIQRKTCRWRKNVKFVSYAGLYRKTPDPVGASVILIHYMDARLW